MWTNFILIFVNIKINKNAENKLRKPNKRGKKKEKGRLYMSHFLWWDLHAYFEIFER